MTQDEIIRMARDGIESYLSNGGLFNPEEMSHDKVRELIILCRDALAEQAEQEPVAWGNPRADEIVTGLYRKFKEWSQRGFGADDVTWCEVKAEINRLIELCAAPVRTKDLTDDEIETIFEYWYSQPETEVWSTVDLARAVIAADRELNK